MNSIKLEQLVDLALKNIEQGAKKHSLKTNTVGLAEIEVDFKLNVSGQENDDLLVSTIIPTRDGAQSIPNTLEFKLKLFIDKGKG